MLSEIDAELKLVIAGNHDRSLDKEHWKEYIRRPGNSHLDEREHEQAMELMRGQAAQDAGVT